VGVDISPSMRALAASYVNSPNFVACAPEAIDWLQLGLKFDAALAVWVLQHCYAVEDDITRIQQALVDGGRLFVVNDRRRIVPTREAGWVDDGKNVSQLMCHAMEFDVSGELDPVSVGALIADNSYWAVWRT
jgi:SAM-dependent methyltransferase